MYPYFTKINWNNYTCIQGCQPVHNPATAGISGKVPAPSLYLRGDVNKTLLALAQDKADKLRRATKDNMVDYAVTYGKFVYQAGSWPHPRRVVFKIEKPAGQIIFMYTFIVTAMDFDPYQVI